MPLLALGALACDEGSSDTPIASKDFSISMGFWDAQGESFVGLQEGQPVDIIMGFQGLVFVNLAILTEEDIPARFSAEGTLVFEDTGEEIPFFDNQVLFETLVDEWRVVPSFRIPLNLPVSLIEGRPVRLDVQLLSGSMEWSAESSSVFLLHDGECEHTPTGEFVCL